MKLTKDELAELGLDDNCKLSAFVGPNINPSCQADRKLVLAEMKKALAAIENGDTLDHISYDKFYWKLSLDDLKNNNFKCKLKLKYNRAVNLFAAVHTKIRWFVHHTKKKFAHIVQR